MTVSISPVFNGQQFFDNDGNPLNGGKIFQYEAGSFSTQQTTYSDNTGSTPNANPIVLDSSGRIPVELWLTDGQAYNLVLTLDDDTTVLTNVDNVIGVVNSTSGGQLSTAVWTEVLDVPTYVSSTQFLVPGNLVQEFAVGNRVQCESTPGTYTYGTVSAVLYSNPNTQVTLANDSSNISVGLTKVYWSVMTKPAPAVDAGAVTYSVPSSYVSSYTLGYKVKTLDTSLTTTNNKLAATQLVYTAAGTDNYTFNVSPAITSYSVNSVFSVKFSNANTGYSTININGVGQVALQSYDSNGVLGVPTIAAGMVSNIAFNGSAFVLLNQLPGAIASTTFPRGEQIFSSSGIFTVPANVYSVKVTCVGGGGAGGTGGNSGSPDFYNVSGGNGGDGGVSVAYVAVSPANTHSIVIGTGGTVVAGIPQPGTATNFDSFVAASGGQAGSAGGPGGPGINGARGFSTIGSYGMNTVFYQGSTARGVGGTGGAFDGNFGNNGTNGLCIVEW
jgi:hypothetical protein